MSDMADDESALFESAMSGEPQGDLATQTSPETVVAPVPSAAVVPAQTDPAIPPGVLREANERARAAERRAADLEARFAALERQQQPKEPPKRTEMFDDPSRFVQEEVNPHLQLLHAELIRNREELSQDRAERTHGAEKVSAAFAWIKEGLANHDPEMVATYRQAMQSTHPYDVVTRAHQQRMALTEIGGDLNGYRERILAEAMKDPEYQAKVLDATRQIAQQSGQTIARPVTSLPSLTKVGAAALPAGTQEAPSDAELFQSATARRKRG